MNRFMWLSLSMLSFMACTALKTPDESPDSGHAGAGRGGSHQSGAPGDIGGDGGGHDVGGAGAGGTTMGGTTMGGTTMGGAGEGGVGEGGGAGDGGETAEPCGDAVETTGTTYYFCACDAGADPRCQVGSGLNDGTDPEAPKLGYAAARDLFASVLQAGDTVALCRGGAWNADPNPRWSNPNCTAEDPCTIRDYQPSWDEDGTAGRPLINAGAGVGVHLFGGTGLQLLNLELRGSNLGLSVEKGVSDVLLCGLVLDGFDQAAHLTDGGGATSRIELRHSTIRNTKRSALTAGDPCNDCVIEGNRFEQNGLAAINGNLDTIYFGAGQPPFHLEIRNNVFHTESEDKARCFGPSISLAGKSADGALIEGNTVEDTGSDHKKGADCGRMFIGWKDSLVAGATMRGNRFSDVGHQGIQVQFCKQCVIENNIYSRSSTMFDTSGASLPFVPFHTQGMTEDLIFRNNTVFAAEGVDAGKTVILGFYPNYTYPGFVATNNLVLFRGTATEFDFMEVPGIREFEWVDNNLCFFPNVPDGLWIDSSLEEWRKNGFDLASFNEDPQIVETPGPTFLAPASATSTVVDAGNTSRASSKDINGKLRDPVAPDIGAIEF